VSGSEENAVDWRPDVPAIAERLRPVTERLEAMRLAAISKRKRATGIALGISGAGWAVALGMMAQGNSMPALVIGVAATLIGLLVFWIIAGKAKKEYLAEFKHSVFAGAVSRAVPGISYFPESMVPEGSFENGGLFSSRIDRYNGEDCFSGRCGATDLIFSELHVEREESSTDSKGNRKTRWVTVFKGIYLIADFHKDFSCRMKILPDVAEANFGWIGRKLQGISGDLVRLENPEFEQAFKVTASDQLAARYLLTPDMQERFLELRGKWSPEIRAAFLDSSLHLAIPLKEDWFQPDMALPAHDAGMLGDFLSQLMIVLHITETLDLNTRIWTKE
jgi:Protein of unknown function (DUF3137)